MFHRGSLVLARPHGVAIQIHFSAILGAAVLSGFRLGAGVAFLLIILCHELGHALLAAALRLQVDVIQIHALGGECRYSGRITPLRRSIVAWGGVLAQGVLLLGAVAYPRAFGWPHSVFGRQFLVDGLFFWNIVIIGFNLLPAPMLDGWHAWQLPRWLFRRQRTVLVRPPPTPPRQPLQRQPHRVPPRHTPQQPFQAHAGGGASGPISTASVVYDSDIRLPAETEAYLKAVLERTRKKSQPKN